MGKQADMITDPAIMYRVEGMTVETDPQIVYRFEAPEVETTEAQKSMLEKLMILLKIKHPS